jgi:hypothetical protein
MCVCAGKRMRMVQRVRTDGGSGKQVTVSFKEEVPSDWASSEDEGEEDRAESGGASS